MLLSWDRIKKTPKQRGRVTIMNEDQYLISEVFSSNIPVVFHYNTHITLPTVRNIQDSAICFKHV